MRSLLALTFVLAPLQTVAALPASARSRAHCRVDHAQYAALTRGMSYRRVRARLGCGGRRVSDLTIGHVRRTTYSWPGRGSYGANLTLTFRNDQLTDKSQLGLRVN